MCDALARFDRIDITPERLRHLCEVFNDNYDLLEEVAWPEISAPQLDHSTPVAGQLGGGARHIFELQGILVVRIGGVAHRDSSPRRGRPRLRDTSLSPKG